MHISNRKSKVLDIFNITSTYHTKKQIQQKIFVIQINLNNPLVTRRQYHEGICLTQ
jgi:hypothetical protein